MQKVSGLLILSIAGAVLMSSCSGSGGLVSRSPVLCGSADGVALADGCSGVPAGAPQFPHLLDGYAVRPSWNVAGVDYAVGVPDGTVLKDPTTDSLPSGCSFSSSTVTCSGDNIILQGYDFSLHSTNLSFSGSNNTITENNFGGTVCNAPQIRLISAGSTTITYNTIDGGGAICTAPALGAIVYGDYISGAIITREYNWMKNAPEDITKNAGPSSGYATIIDRFNLFEQQGWTGHPDGIQLNGGNFSNSFYSFNTYRNRDVGQPIAQAQGTQPVHIESQLNAYISNYTVNNNVILTSGTGWQTANVDIACKIGNSGSNTNTGFSAYGNYIDATGALMALNDGYGCTGTSWGTPTPNYNIVTGAVIAAP
jgi:hypothetical protein